MCRVSTPYQNRLNAHVFQCEKGYIPHDNIHEINTCVPLKDTWLGYIYIIYLFCAKYLVSAVLTWGMTEKGAAIDQYPKENYAQPGNGFSLCGSLQQQ